MNNKNKTTPHAMILLPAVLFLCCLQEIATAAEGKLTMNANELAKNIIIIDTHQDVPYRIRKKNEDISQRTTGGNFDYPRARKGGLDAVFMAAYVPSEYEQEGGARIHADETISLIEGWAKTWPDKFVLAHSVADIKTQFGKERISLVIAIENGSAIEGNLGNLKHFYDRGVRYITLVHARNNHICDSSFDNTRKWHGLSPFGMEVVPEMNRMGIMIDVSHVSDDTFYQIIKLSRAPVAATHSCCRHFTPGYERNMSDEMIKLLAEKGGVIQINFGSMFVNGQVNKKSAERRKHIEQYAKAHDLKGEQRDEYAEQYLKANPVGDSDISDVVANIDHVAKLVGIDYVGLGSDFDGVGDNLPNGLKDVSCYPNLIGELLKKGYTEKDIKKICAENFFRVWSDVERIAKELQAGN